MNQVYTIVSDKILSLLDKGVVPWRKPWVGGEQSWPLNGISKKRYRGINPFLCGVSGVSTSTIENSAAYIANWKAAIKADNKLVLVAAAQAQKAADFILDKYESEA